MTLQGPLLRCEDPLTRIRETAEIRDKIYAGMCGHYTDVDNRHSHELAEELQPQLRKQKDIQRKKERKKDENSGDQRPESEFSGNP